MDCLPCRTWSPQVILGRTRRVRPATKSKEQEKGQRPLLIALARRVSYLRKWAENDCGSRSRRQGSGASWPKRAEQFLAADGDICHQSAQTLPNDCLNPVLTNLDLECFWLVRDNYCPARD